MEKCEHLLFFTRKKLLTFDLHWDKIEQSSWYELEQTVKPLIFPFVIASYYL